VGTTADRTAYNDGRAKKTVVLAQTTAKGEIRVCVQKDITRNEHNTVRAVILAQTAAKYKKTQFR